MPPSFVHRWAEFIGAERLLFCYGMSEERGVTMIRADEWMEHPGSVGRPVWGSEVRVLDAEGKDALPGQVGEIYLRSSLGPGRYLGDVPALQSTADGFTTVGDMGYLDANWYLLLADRRVDMIVSRGANVYPAEVEAALIDHENIADVVVIGLKDEHWGRRVHAVVQATDPSLPSSAEEVIAYANSRLAAYKVPKTVEFVDAVPRSAATKVNRRALVDARDG
jgi:bile acid-coenzyme A ligase